MLKIEVPGLQYREYQLRKEKFQVAPEVTLSFSLNNLPVVSAVGSGGYEKEWAIGHLFRTHQIESMAQVESIEKKDSVVMITARKPVEATPIIPESSTKSIVATQLLALTAAFKEKSYLYKDTGAYFSAGLADTSTLLITVADIDRLIAFDKLIGQALLENVSGVIMMVSGPMCQSVVNACARLGIALIVSRSAPTWQAIQLAEKSEITLVGFARGPRFAIYGKNHVLRAD